jgi:moderate conductance mechanosensitive channel
MISSIDPRDLATGLAERGLGLLLVLVVVFLSFRAIRPLAHRLMVRLLSASMSDPDDDGLTAAEVRKRVATVEGLFSTILRFTVVLIAALVVLTWFNLLPVIAGLGVLAAALTLAGQSIVLDYLMGVLIVLEGPYYKGDVVRIGAVEGEVEEVGLRRTTLRDASGTVHTVSNGEVRVASNLTRIYARMIVEVTVAFATDLDRAATIVNEAGRGMKADPEWADRLLETPALLRVDALSDLGATLRISGKVRAADRWAAPGELRKRIVAAFQANGIEIPARGRVMFTRETASPGAGPDPTGGAEPGDAPGDAAGDPPGGASAAGSA